MNEFKIAKNIVRNYILLAVEKGNEITADFVMKIIEKQIAGNSLFENINLDDLLSSLMNDLDMDSGTESSIQSDEVLPWLDDKKSQIEWEYYDRYEQYMMDKNPSFPINSLNRSTDTILDKCIDPSTPGEWDRRGMVVGHVQSGKTSNYIGLINKAIDVGYKMIIVMAGMLGSLRLQTQSRIDKGVIGRDSGDYIDKRSTNTIGVGRTKVKRSVFSYTSDKTRNGADRGDFNTGIADRLNVPIDGDSPTVLVIKKNYRILENLIFWLSGYGNKSHTGFLKIKNVPLLLIDDEADHASVNSAKPEEDIKRINRDIRALLNLFVQKTFVGYTATPYANLFILEEYEPSDTFFIREKEFQIGSDLFPRHFIINISPPANYIGARKVFGFQNEITGENAERLDLIRSIQFDGGRDEYYEPEPYIPRKISLRQNNRQALPHDLPPSLKTAVKQFILVCAIRRLRGQHDVHNSMLVHVARFVLWSDRVAVLIDNELKKYQRLIAYKDPDFLSSLKRLYLKDFLKTTDSVTKILPDYYNDPLIKVHKWEEVLSHLHEASQGINVRAVVGRTRRHELEFEPLEELDYDRYPNGFSVIAVGGTKLSRGLTLEGLSVSYFLRTSRMYDSLMQMGRWFGYRPGYVDLCRLWTTTQLIDWYRHITLATEEMRSDFDHLAAVNKKPADYPLKVRTHSGQLQISARNRIFGRSKIEYHSYSGMVIQTSEFQKNNREKNIQALHQLISKLRSPVHIKQGKNSRINRILFSGRFSEEITGFLLEYCDQLRVDPKTLREYIFKQNENGKLLNWSVQLFSSTTTAETYSKLNIGDQSYSVGLVSRGDKTRDKLNLFTLAKSNIQGGFNDLKFDLEYMADSPPDFKKPTGKTAENYKRIRASMNTSLLIIYLLNYDYSESEEFIPTVGFYLEIQRLRDEIPVEYKSRLEQESDPEEDEFFESDETDYDEI